MKVNRWPFLFYPGLSSPEEAGSRVFYFKFLMMDQEVFLPHNRAWPRSEAADKPFLALSAFSPDHFWSLASILASILPGLLDCHPP